MDQFFLGFLILSFFISSSTTFAQQNYSANSALDCNSSDETGPSPAFLYTCNGQNNSCEAFLIFKSQTSYDSVPTISSLTSANQDELARINNVTRIAKFPPNKEVIVPVHCSCFGQYYQANTTFHATRGYSYYIVASQTYEGLSTCASLKRANEYGEFDLGSGVEMHVPLRCACPTSTQLRSAVNYLLTYPINFGDSLAILAERFNTSERSIIDANGLEENPVIYPDTTILIPLQAKPTSSITIIHEGPPNVSRPSAPSPGDRTSKRKLYEWIGIAAACSLLLLSVTLAILLLLCRERRNKALESNHERNHVLLEDLRVEIASVEQVLKVFGLKEVKKATENFSSKHRINGSVYWGEFDGEMLAIKKMRRDVSKEVNILKKINHFNLIKLRGVCENLGCFYLVFEYMKNGSLREWLSGERSEYHGSWSTRIQIAMDVANGLHYLHSFTEPACVHKDIKSSNILLDSKLRAKIANFGHARAAARGTTTNAAVTKHVEGTRGYMAPEYVQAGQVTPKIDVYAFGVVLLELITGKDAVFIQDGRETLLSTATVSILQKENAEAELALFIHPSFLGSHDIKLALRLARVSLACLVNAPEKRPGMGEIVSTLLKIQECLAKTKPLEVDSVDVAAPKWHSSIGSTNWRAEAISK
ncbi:lysM domain receptor-like kinase 4 [Manihot esculenta]|uniref:Protein kinase domain-containing protein n=1 Tax=Manihot esculenta TaxID=3983 RepID=A0A2C9U1P3_MANES|nr:lysM domain receptor-like kinase 4 [Manihot esculenta]OAY22846.1 hypothetical protein MANES_18G030700v8 [Manihot esculenta]